MSTSPTNPLFKYEDYQATIGIEVHVQLKTNSKIFCSCPNIFGQEPNTNICPVCTGLPGALPVLNKKVLDYAIMTGLATNCSITRESEFSRKHYMYPDLPKNYQITQDDRPICQNGSVNLKLENGQTKKIRIKRIHMEEDAGKNIHTSQNISLVDLNRAGTPLMEIVSEPDIEDADQAKEYLTKLHSIVRYLGVSDANMDEGSFRADVNISVKKKSATQLGTRVEIKNVNSFKYITQAINYEIERHIELLENGSSLSQETRQWDSKNDKTIFMRSKEETQDYRYFADPDLPLIIIDQEMIDSLKAAIPELPDAKYNRLQQQYGLSPYEADIFVLNQEIADFFEETLRFCANPKLASNIILRDVLSFLKENKVSIGESKITAQNLAELIHALDKGFINSKVGQDVFAEMAATGASPHFIIDQKNLKQIDSEDTLEPIIVKIIADNQDSVAKYRAGNERLFTFFVGQAMKATSGKASPAVLSELLKKHLNK